MLPWFFCLSRFGETKILLLRQGLFDLEEQVLAGERLLQVGSDVALAGWPDVAAGAKDAHGRREPVEMLDEFAAAHGGHDQVGNDQVHPGVPGHEVQRFLPAVGRQHLVAVGREDRLAHRQQQVLVIDHEDRLAPGQVIGREAVVSDNPPFGGQINPH